MDSNKLYKKAQDACKFSYAPYSKISVGAVAILEEQTLVAGANFENIASPACTCAEQSLVGTLNSLYHGKKVIAIAIAAYQNGDIINISPCGLCRQILLEYQTKQNSNISIIFRHNNELISTNSVNELIPLAFDTLNHKK